MKLVIIDPAHGGKDPGAVNGKKHEAVLSRAVVKLLVDKLQADGKITAKTSFDACGKDISKDSWTAQERRADLANYHKKTATIDYLLSIHLNSSVSPAPSGLVIFHNNRPNDAQIMYNAMVEYFDSYNINIRGDRTEKIANQPGLSVLNAEAANIINVLSVGAIAAENLKLAVKRATENFKISSGASLFEMIEHLSDQTYASGSIVRDKYNSYLKSIGSLTDSFESTGLLYVSSKAGAEKAARVPALLIEAGFISNATDLKLLSENPEAFAYAIAEGIYKITAPAFEFSHF